MPESVYTWLVASSVPKISAVPDRIWGWSADVVKLACDRRGKMDLDFNLNTYGDFEAPFCIGGKFVDGDGGG